MNMGWVLTIAGLLTGMAIVLPGALLVWALLLPKAVDRARLRLERTPGRCVSAGLILLIPAVLVLAALFAVAAGPLQIVAWSALGALVAAASLGATGLCALMARRARAQGGVSAAALVRSAVALELALLFPLAGWFVLTPLVALASLGAAFFALLGWMPRPRAQAQEVSHAPQPS
jgi:hypothetical protein